jgi:hypothetical protein
VAAGDQPGAALVRLRQTYRPVAQAIAQALPADHGCLAERGLSDTQLASLSYFVEIEPVAEDSKAGQACNWLLVVGDKRRELAPPSSRWIKVWEATAPATAGKIPPVASLKLAITNR